MPHRAALDAREAGHQLAGEEALDLQEGTRVDDRAKMTDLHVVAAAQLEQGWSPRSAGHPRGSAATGATSATRSRHD